MASLHDVRDGVYERESQDKSVTKEPQFFEMSRYSDDDSEIRDWVSLSEKVIDITPLTEAAKSRK
jgi:hypothetical protein